MHGLAQRFSWTIHGLTRTYANIYSDRHRWVPEDGEIDSVQQRKAKREADNVPTADGARGGDIAGAGASVARVEPARDEANKQHAEVIGAKHSYQELRYCTT